MLCAIARLPAEARDRLRRVQSAASTLGFSPTPLYGHITLAVCDSGDEDAFAAGCRDALTGFGPIPVRYERIEILSETTIIVAAPARTEALLYAHRVLADRFADWLDPWTRDERWRPHTTLFHHPTADLAPLRDAMAARFAPFDTQITRVELSRVMKNGYRIVGGIEIV